MRLLKGIESLDVRFDSLHKGLFHVAGTHLAEKAKGKADLLPISKMFVRNSIAVLSYATWKEGLIVAQDNPKKIAVIEDLARKDIRITNREPDAGCRRLLDDLLRKNLSPKMYFLNGPLLDLHVTCQIGPKSFRIWRGRRDSNSRPLP